MLEGLPIIGALALMGAIFMAIAVPLIRGSIPRNLLYGFRTRKTLSSDEIWYPANAYMGRDLLVVGIIELAAAAVLLPFGALLSPLALTCLMLALTVIPLTVAVIRGLIYVSKL